MRQKTSRGFHVEFESLDPMFHVEFEGNL